MTGKFHFDIEVYVGDRADKAKVSLGLTTWLVLAIEKSHYGWPKRLDVLYEVIRCGLTPLDRTRLDKTRVDRSWFNPLCRQISKEYAKLRGDSKGFFLLKRVEEKYPQCFDLLFSDSVPETSAPAHPDAPEAIVGISDQIHPLNCTPAAAPAHPGKRKKPSAPCPRQDSEPDQATVVSSLRAQLNRVKKRKEEQKEEHSTTITELKMELLAEKAKTQDWRCTATERRDELKKSNDNMEHLRLKYNALVRDFDFAEEDRATLEHRLSELTPDDLKHITEEHIEFPEKAIRKGLHGLDPDYISVLAELRFIHKIALGNCATVFACVCNGWFNQKYKLGNSDKKNRRNRDLIPKTCTDEGSSSHREKVKIDGNTLTSKSYIQKAQLKLHFPLASMFTARALKKCDVATGQFDGGSEQRSKFLVSGAIARTGDTVEHFSIGVTEQARSDNAATFQSLQFRFRYLAAVSSESTSGEDMFESLKQVMRPFKYFVTDDGAQMDLTVKRIGEWRKALGIAGETYRFHCVAHIAPALLSALTKVLLDLEGVIGIRKYVVESYNASFHGANKSCILTMAFSIMNCIGSSKQNQEWSQTIAFAWFLKEQGEPRNHLQDAKSSRFGKMSEFLALISYHYGNIEQFFTTMTGTDRMFVSCERYITCPKFKEISLAVAIVYYHFVRPFLIAAGTETQLGYKALSHMELCSFFPALINALKTVAGGEVEAVLAPEPLLYLEQYPEIVTITHKGHKAIYHELFKRISEESEGVSMIVLRSSVQMISAAYATVFHDQTARYYLENGIIPRLLAEDEHCLDGVSTSALGAERQVGQVRANSKRAPTSKMFSHGISQVVDTSPYLNFCQQATREEKRLLYAEIKGEKFEIAEKLLKQEMTVVARHRTEKSQQSKDTRAQAIIKRSSRIQAVKEHHNGPITSVDQLDGICSQTRDKKLLGVILRDEIFYQRDVVYGERAVVDRAIFVASKSHKQLDGTRQTRLKPIDELTKNLKELLDPENYLAPQLKELSDEVFKAKADEVLNKLLARVPRNCVTSTMSTYIVPGRFVATVWEYEGQIDWYIGQISRVINPRECGVCKKKNFRNSLTNSLTNSHQPCFEVRSLKPSNHSEALYEWLDLEQVHCLTYQVLCQVTMAAVSNEVFECLEPSVTDLDELLENSPCTTDLRSAS